VTTWKGGINYSPVQDVRLRGTVSRDIRAPSVNELFQGQIQNVQFRVDPRPNSPNTNPSVKQFTGGNPNLTPEESKAYTIGVVYQPSFIEGLRTSVDYYSFDITDAIATFTGQDVINGCFKRNQQTLCNTITLDATGVITATNLSLLNAASVKSSGIDLEIGYGMPLGV